MSAYNQKTKEGITHLDMALGADKASDGSELAATLGYLRAKADEEAEKILLDHTASAKWDDIANLDWSSQEVHGILMDLILKR